VCIKLEYKTASTLDPTTTLPLQKAFKKKKKKAQEPREKINKGDREYLKTIS
jgi:hypothetical protein